MIKKINDVYQDCALKHDLDPAFIKSIGDHVFAHLKYKMLALDDTNLWVANFGYWVVKSRRIENECKRYLGIRKYKQAKYPGYIDKPVGSFMKKLFSMYLNKIMKFKKVKHAFSLKQVEFCKNIVEQYKKEDNVNDNNTNS